MKPPPWQQAYQLVSFGLGCSLLVVDFVKGLVHPVGHLLHQAFEPSCCLCWRHHDVFQMRKMARA